MSYVDPTGNVGFEIGPSIAAQLGLVGGSYGENIAFTIDFSNGDWQFGTTKGVQVRAGAGLYGGAGYGFTVTPSANKICDLEGESYGAGFEYGVGFKGVGGQLMTGSGGMSISVGTPVGVGAGVAGFGAYGNTFSSQVKSQGNFYKWLGIK